MDKHLKAQLAKSSAQLDIEILLEDKSDDFKKGFYCALEYCSSFVKELMNIYYGE